MNESSQGGGFRQSELLHVFAKERLRCFAKTANAKRTATAEGDLIGVVLKNLLLGELALQVDGDQQFFELAAPGFARIEPNHFGELLGEGRCAIDVVPMGDIDENCFGNAQRIEAGVLKESLVFDRYNSVDQYGWNIVELNEPALGAVGVEHGA